jgi:hypothetical protein
MRTIAFAAGAAALAVLAGGCGGAGAAGPGAADGAASVLPSNVLEFVAADTDFSSSAWHGLGALVPSGPGISADDLQALAGGEVDVAVLPGKRTVALVQPADEAKLEAYASTHDLKLRKLGDWVAVAADTATLDAVAGATQHLADNTLYLDAMSRLPTDALVRAYASGAEAYSLLTSIPGQLQGQQIPGGARFRQVKERPGIQFGYATQDFRWLAAALTSTGDGLKLDAFAPSGGLVASVPPRFVIHPSAPYTPGLPDEIPAGAVAVVDVRLAPGAFELMPELPPALQRLFPGRPDLANDLDAALGGETALYVRPAVPMPEITLVTQPPDTEAASKMFDQLAAATPKDSPLSKLALHQAIIGGQLVASTTQAGIEAFRGGGAKLSADRSFLDAKKHAGMPDTTTGFVYVNAKTALPLLALAGVSVPAGAPDLSTFLAYGSLQHGGSGVTAFLGVR